MRQVPDQPVRQVDHAAGDPAQGQPEIDARLRRLQAANAERAIHVVEHGLGAQGEQAERGVAERAGDPDIVTNDRTIAQDGLAARDFAENGHAKCHRSAAGVATDQLDFVTLRQREKTGGEARHPIVIKRGQGERQGGIARQRAHCRQIRKVDRQRLVAEPARVGIGQKVGAGHQHVG